MTTTTATELLPVAAKILQAADRKAAVRDALKILGVKNIQSRKAGAAIVWQAGDDLTVEQVAGLLVECLSYAAAMEEMRK